MTSKDHVPLAPWVDLYGFRGKHPHVHYLSPWEFVELIAIVPLLPPWKYAAMRQAPLTEWTTTGEDFYRVHQNDDPATFLKPGDHYVVRECITRMGYILYPDEPELSTFRHEWVMRRHVRPLIASPNKTPMPESTLTRKVRARLFSTYLRTWVLSRRQTSPHVPHLSDLDLVPSQLTRHRCRRKGPAGAPQERCFYAAWRHYIRGHVVSEHAKQIIVNFMSACGSGTRHDKDSDEEPVKPEAPDIPGLSLSLDRVHAILRRQLSIGSKAHRRDEDVNAEDQGNIPMSGTISQAVDLCDTLWGEAARASDDVPVQVDATGHKIFRPKEVDADEAKGSEDVKDKRKPPAKPKKRKKAAKRQQPTAMIYAKYDAERVRQWLIDVRAEEEAPNAIQLKFLQDVAARCALEAREESTDAINAASESAPMRPMIQGLPGGGKSKLIKWVCRFFQEALGWTHGVEYVCLASQNTMAALIGGRTFHSWGEIAVNKETSRKRRAAIWARPDISSMYEKTQNLRWILIDEGSTASAEILAALDSTLRKCIRPMNTYAVDQDGKRRSFGGLNVAFFVDYWQLPPVNATPCFANPLRGHSSSVQQMLDMFWSKSPSSFTNFVELTQEMRCKDLWLSALLQECRTGSQQFQMYWFLHGLPTETTGSWMPQTNRPECGDPACQDLASKIWPEMRRDGAAWEERQRLECPLCRKERARRARVRLTPEDKRHMGDTFVGAPYVHPYNAPKYQALQYRASIFAQSKQRMLLWIVARDTPDQTDDKALKGPALDRQRERWLQLHDQQTGGIMGLFPCVRDMPVRFTATVDRDKKIFKNGRGILLGWELSDLDAQRAATQRVSELVLLDCPKHLYVKVDKADWTITEDLGVGVYPLKPRKSNPWARDAAGNATVKRYGFQLIPDFSGTVHSYTGANLEAENADCLQWDKRPRREDQLRGYIALSRVEYADKLLIMQPYSPWLFRQGELPGPHILRRFWREEITQEDIATEWERLSEARLSWKQIEDMPLPCWSCSEKAGVETMLPLKMFASDNSWNHTVGLGADAICAACKKQRAEKKRVHTRFHHENAPAGHTHCVVCNNNKPDTDFDKDKLDQWRQGGHMTRATCQQCSTKSVHCVVCDRTKPDTDFDKDELEQLRTSKHTTRATCQQCTMQGSRKRGKWRQFSPQDSTKCCRCQEQRLYTQYDTARLRRWLHHEDLDNAVCLFCDPTGLPTQRTSTHTCNKCRKVLSLHAFSLSTRKKKDAKRWRCEACERPTCQECGERPELPLQYPIDDPADYMCLACLYPPCAGGCGQTRERRRTHHGKTRERRWYCTECHVCQQ